MSLCCQTTVVLLAVVAMRQCIAAPVGLRSATQTRTNSSSHGQQRVRREPSWSYGPNVPGNLDEVATAIHNRKIYLIGGADGGTFVFDISSNVWSHVRQRPHLGDHSGMHTIGNKIYVIGGFRHGQGLVQIYNVDSNQWSVSPNRIPSVAEGSLCTAEIGGMIYACGGLGDGTNPENCYMFAPNTGTWVEQTSMIRGVDHAATGTDGSKMYVFGGRDSGINRPGDGNNWLQIYTPGADGGSWRRGQNMPFGRSGMGRAEYFNGNFYIMGGEYGSGVYNHLDLYNVITEVYTSGPNMLRAVHGISPITDTTTGLMYVPSGGVRQGYSQSDLLQILDTGETQDSTQAPTTHAPTFPPMPTQSPVTSEPTQVPTTSSPTVLPSISWRTESSTSSPSSSSPTTFPSLMPTSSYPSSSPSLRPTISWPTESPTSSPSSSSPTTFPSLMPTSSYPSSSPSLRPTISWPTESPTSSPSSSSPSVPPSLMLTSSYPSSSATLISSTPSPSYIPTQLPSEIMSSMSPSHIPRTRNPTYTPTIQPSRSPSYPTFLPTTSPTSSPTFPPSLTPIAPYPTTLPTIPSTISPTAPPTQSSVQSNQSGNSNFLSLYLIIGISVVVLLFLVFISFRKFRKDTPPSIAAESNNCMYLNSAYSTNERNDMGYSWV